MNDNDYQPMINDRLIVEYCKKYDVLMKGLIILSNVKPYMILR